MSLSGRVGFRSRLFDRKSRPPRAPELCPRKYMVMWVMQHTSSEPRHHPHVGGDLVGVGQSDATKIIRYTAVMTSCIAVSTIIRSSLSIGHTPTPAGGRPGLHVAGMREPLPHRWTGATGCPHTPRTLSTRKMLSSPAGVNGLVEQVNMLPELVVENT